MAPSPSKRKSTKPQVERRAERLGSNLVSGLSVVVLGLLAYFDLQNPTDTVPNLIYYGLIGSALGAKYEDIINVFRGGKK